jgi:hypothetical protein
MDNANNGGRAMKRTISAGQRRYLAIKKVYPDVYTHAGIGWCGPGWREAQAMEEALKAAEAAAEAR